MNDHKDNLKKIKESTDAVFNEILGFGKKKNPEVEYKSGEGQAIKTGDVYRMGNSVITKLRGVNEYDFLNYDFKNSPLSWLLNGVFKGHLDLKLSGREEVVGFIGVWKKGIFKGRHFAASSIFEGGEFGDNDSSPIFSPPYTNWKTSPHYFNNGVIENTAAGILGIKNLPNGEVRGKGFNILALKPGNSITLVLGDGTKKVVTCKQRMGGSNNMFVYSVDGQDLKYEWSTLKGNSVDDFNKITRVHLSPQQKSIDVFKIKSPQGIKSAFVSVEGTTPLKMSDEDSEEKIDYATTQQKFDLGQIPGLKVKYQQRGPGGKMLPLPPEAKGNAYFYIPDQEYMKKFEEVIENIKGGIFQKDINLVRGGIRNGLVTGAGKDNQYLISIFGDEGDNTKAPKEIKSSLSRLNDFMRFFVDRMYVQGDNNTEDDARQKLVTDKLRSALGVQASQPSGEDQPGEPEKPKKVKKVKIKEIRELVRNIISDNM